MPATLGVVFGEYKKKKYITTETLAGKVWSLCIDNEYMLQSFLNLHLITKVVAKAYQTVTVIKMINKTDRDSGDGRADYILIKNNLQMVPFFDHECHYSGCLYIVPLVQML